MNGCLYASRISFRYRIPFRRRTNRCHCSIAAYHRRDFPLSAIWFSPREHSDISLSIATPFERTSNVGLGSLDRLPQEVLRDTLCRLDMRSLFNFRQINLRSRQTVDSFKKYQLIVSHGLNLLCALLRSRLAADFSLLDFYDALCIKACRFCGEFGGFISLLTWERSCFECLKEAPETQVLSLTTARRIFGLTKLETNQLRSFKSLPGIYTMRQRVLKSRIAIASIHEASLINNWEFYLPGQAYAAISRRDKKLNFMGSCALPYYDDITGYVDYGMSCAGCQLGLEKDIIENKAEKRAFEARDEVYSRDGFLEHFRWCEQAQLLYKSSCEGIKTPTELPEAARRGGYFNDRE